MTTPRTHFWTLLVASLLFSTMASAQLVINEYSCSNININTDNYGENEDWIELYNNSGSTIDLTGYWLSDKGGNPLKWEFPSGSINAGDHMLIWCNSRNEATGGTFHTSFRITQTRNEKIMLSDPAGTLLDSVTIVPALTDRSRGRATDGGSDWTVFDTPSPDGANNGPIQDYTPRPELDMPAGFYTGSVSVTLTSPNPNATVYYTLDGSTPTMASTQATGPINITATTVVRSIAIDPAADMLPSFIETNTYFIDEVHTMKVISLGGDDIETLFNGTQFEPQAHFEIFEKDGTFIDETYAEYNEHGNDSWAYPQRGADFITRDQFGYNGEIRGQLFNGKSRDGFQRLIIKAAASDNYPFENGGCHLRDAYVQTLSQIGDLRLDERSYEPCVMYLNGQYWGLYEIREKVDDLDFTDYYYNQGRFSTQMVKTWGGTWNEFGGPAAGNDWDALVNYITTNDMSIQANYDSAKSQLNMGSLIDYFSLNSYVVCIDWLNWNTGWWRGLNPAGTKKKWRYFLWDMDAVFGHYVNFTGMPDTSPSADPCQAENLNDPGGQGHTEIMTALMASPEFEQEYVSRYIDLGNTVFGCDFMLAHLDSLIELLEPEMQRHVDLWGGSYSGWEQNCTDLRDYIADRCVQVDGGLIDCYEVEGPYPVTWLVDPAGSPNTIKINTIEPDVPEYPFEGDWFGNIDILLEAMAGQGWNFDYWEAGNHTFSPSDTDVETILSLLGSDTVIAHFVEDSTILTVLVDPPGSGEVSVDFTPLPGYPWSNMYLPGTNISLEATANAGWEFDTWSADNHTMNPNNTNSNVFFTITSTDTVIAHFRESPKDIMYRVVPPAGGSIAIDGTTPGGFPYTDSYYPLTNLNLVAMANPNYDFSNWTAGNHTLNPDVNTDDVDFITSTTDTITAYFTEHPLLTVDVMPAASGMVAVDAADATPLPWTSYYPPGTTVHVAATAAENFEFDHWEIANHTLVPSDQDIAASFDIGESTTLIGHFRPLEAVLVMPNIFTPNGDGQNDLFAATEYVNVVSAELLIFNRWGRTVCTIADLEAGWDGTCDGRTIESGTYFYTVSYVDHLGEENTLEGSITLIR